MSFEALDFDDAMETWWRWGPVDRDERDFLRRVWNLSVRLGVYPSNKSGAIAMPKPQAEWWMKTRALRMVRHYRLKNRGKKRRR
jgi:hypothetical protein